MMTSAEKVYIFELLQQQGGKQMPIFFEVDARRCDYVQYAIFKHVQDIYKWSFELYHMFTEDSQRGSDRFPAYKHWLSLL